ncbi:vacuolar sorting-associated 26A-like isoform A [Chlorella sorokiniana]|uniref:Vacuolar sorting-associated 26A-like isoform A n=1 Tax=Chlorella sorokiniana TaxID=3076 RepID=A0A2P6TP70_CHLSO|nr:vacuolar sorting-associated 26A-like isoform A [Chlorella sorokiniana]|eukprot:PRW51123.1 vacuolar sorting-associated 26A-like isoform A [Chlorella sorokiniana]
MNKLFGGLVGATPCTVQLELRPSAGATAAGGSQPTVTVKNKRDEVETMPLFANKDTISGEVKVTPIPGRRTEHQGIRIQLLGEVELASERGHPHQFLSLVRDLAPPGDLTTQASLPFEFGSVEMQYESYRGAQAQVRYLLRVTVARGMGGSVVKDHAFWVRNTQEVPPPGPPIKMEVGIEDCLHIEFEYDRGAYHMQDTVLGRIHFLLVRIKLKHMELEIRRRETSGAGAAAKSESETVAKYEIMDGAPVRGECIPIRLSLRPYDLSPSYANVFNKFSVRYFINLVLVDEEDRRYFKQQEITLYRRPEEDPQLRPRAARLPRRMPSLTPSPTPPAASPAAAPAAGANGGAVAAAGAAAQRGGASAAAGEVAAAEGHLMPGGAASVGADAAGAAAAEQRQLEAQPAAVQQQEEKGPPLALPAEPPATGASPLGDGTS